MKTKLTNVCDATSRSATAHNNGPWLLYDLNCLGGQPRDIVCYCNARVVPYLEQWSIGGLGLGLSLNDLFLKNKETYAGLLTSKHSSECKVKRALMAYPIGLR